MLKLAAVDSYRQNSGSEMQEVVLIGAVCTVTVTNQLLNYLRKKQLGQKKLYLYIINTILI